MILTAWLVVDPDGDRPYLSTKPPRPEMLRERPGCLVFRYDLSVPDSVPSVVGSYVQRVKESP